jgi:hypothetical protein
MPHDGRPIALSPTQRMLISTLLDELAPARPDLARQAASARAISNCDCGCPSIDIVTAPQSALLVTDASRDTPPHDDMDLFAHSPDGGVYAVVSVRNGQLTELDCTSHGDTPPFPREIPDLHGWTFSGQRVGWSGRSDA